MKGNDETYSVGLGSSLYCSLLLVLFFRFWLVLCLLDFGFVVIVGVVVLLMVMAVMKDERC